MYIIEISWNKEGFSSHFHKFQLPSIEHFYKAKNIQGSAEQFIDKIK